MLLVFYEEALYEAVNNKSILFWVAKDKDKIIGTISFGLCSSDIKECTNNEITDLGSWEVFLYCLNIKGKE